MDLLYLSLRPEHLATGTVEDAAARLAGEPSVVSFALLRAKDEAFLLLKSTKFSFNGYSAKVRHKAWESLRALTNLLYKTDASISVNLLYHRINVSGIVKKKYLGEDLSNTTPLGAAFHLIAKPHMQLVAYKGQCSVLSNMPQQEARHEEGANKEEAQEESRTHGKHKKKDMHLPHAKRHKQEKENAQEAGLELERPSQPKREDMPVEEPKWPKWRPMEQSKLEQLLHRIRHDESAITGNYARAQYFLEIYQRARSERQELRDWIHALLKLLSTHYHIVCSPSDMRFQSKDGSKDDLILKASGDFYQKTFNI